MTFLTPERARRLLHAITKQKHAPRRNTLKALESEWFTELSKSDQDWLNRRVTEALRNSPIVGHGLRTIAISRPTWRAVVDHMSWPVLAAHLAGAAHNGLSVNEILDAIEDPYNRGHPSRTSKTGIEFGRPGRLTDERVAQIIDSLHEFAESHAEEEVKFEPKNTGDLPYKIADDTSVTKLVNITDAIAASLAKKEREEAAEEYGIEREISPATIYAEALHKLEQHVDNSKTLKATAAFVELRRERGQEPSLESYDFEAAPPEARPIIETILETNEAEHTHMDTKTVIDPSFTSAINSLLTNATKGALTSIEVILDDNKALAAKIMSLEEALKEASRRAASAAVPTTVAGDGAIPSGEFVWQRASDIFIGPNGKKSKALDFDVPVWKWDGAHPHVPAVDANYQFRLEHLLKLLYGLVHGKNTWVYGHTGTGKTTLVEQVAARLNWPVIRINLDSNIERADLTGQVVLREKGGATVSEWVDGILPQALGGPNILLCDEMDFGRPDVMYVLQRMLEHNGLMLMEDGGRIVHPHPMSRFIATANTRGQGDEYGCYQGARVQSNALLDRFPLFVEVPYLGREQEERLLTASFPDLNKDDASQMISFANEVREAFMNGELFQTISPRGLMAMADAYLHFLSTMPKKEDALKLACDMTVIDKHTADTQQRVRELANRVFASMS